MVVALMSGEIALSAMNFSKSRIWVVFQRLAHNAAEQLQPFWATSIVGQPTGLFWQGEDVIYVPELLSGKL